MTWKLVIRIGALVGLAWSMGPACSSTTPGTDSNTHWIACNTVADCPSGNSYACVQGHCVASTDSGAPISGGDCPAGVASNGPCDGSVAQCWTACSNGFRGQFVCSGGKWGAGHGLFPCGEDAGRGGSGGSPPLGTGGERADAAAGATGGGSGSPGDAGASDGSRADGGPCAPMDAHTGFLPCVNIVGYAWNGSDCVPIVCSCNGADCSSMYTTDAECRSARAACGAQGINTACQKNSDCMLVDKTCCGTCSEPTLSDKVAINVGSYSAWQASVCRDPVACPPCVPPQGPFQAECVQGQCQAIDLSQYKECLRNEDCAMTPVDCCPCGTLTRNDVTAVNSSATFPGCVAFCTGCAGLTLPSDVRASCYLSGGYCILN